jgi:RNA polymerase sigma-70 factor (ECF subfamily)
MTDTEIIALIQSSPPLGHRALFDEYYSYVYAISVNILRGYGSHEDVDECVIDAFASVINKLGSSSTAPVKPFLGTVAKNRAISMRRSLAAKNGKSISVDSEELGELPSSELVDKNAEDHAMTELLLRKIKELGEPDSGIIIQKYFYEQNANEIGRMMNMNPAAVRMRCARAIKKLRGLLSDFR